MESRGAPSPAKAINALYEIPLPPVAPGLDTFKLPVINVGMIGGGTVVNAVPREAWFTVDLRSLDSAMQDKLATAVVSTVKQIGEKEGVGFRMEVKMSIWTCPLG
jgi:metal-dependent amidase/aminoacylase/carboxypeptidase family protein